MFKKIGAYLMIVVLCMFMVWITAGCDSKDERTKTSKPVIAPGPADMKDKPDLSSQKQAVKSSAESGDEGIAIEVDGVKMTKAQLNEAIEHRLALLKDQVPADKVEDARAEIRKGLIEEFVNSTLIDREVKNKKVTASEKEITDIFERMKAQLPAGKTMEDFIKSNKMDMAKMREEIRTSIKMSKLVMKELGEKANVTEKEISEFYQKNKDKFVKPETVHVRHLLVAKAKGDDEKKIAEKKAKAEDLRKKLLNGADFGDLAAKNSDCPSKKEGGDLGSFTRGQMVKPFEDAAFSQRINEIGPVVETDFGFHIIKVIDHQSAKTVGLEPEIKEQIKGFLEQQRQRQAFEGIMKRLRARANIVVYGK